MFEDVQKQIGYSFKNENLLQQAFVRRSYSNEQGGQNNEILEFIGDKALDLAVIMIMMEEFGEITEGKDNPEIKVKNNRNFKTRLTEGNFTNIKIDLVQRKSLANAIENLGFKDLLIMGNGDSINKIQNEDKVKEDLFEAIVGAVAIDSGYDMKTIVQVVSRMIDFKEYFYNFNNDYILNVCKKVVGIPDLNNALDQVEKLIDKGLITNVAYNFELKYDEYGRDVWTCFCKIDECDIEYLGKSHLKRVAQRISAYYALCDLMNYETENFNELN